MKKTLLAFGLFAGLSFGASAQCTPDTTHFSGSTRVYPASLPCIVHGQSFAGVVSIQVPDSADAHDFQSNIPANYITAFVDSIKIDAISGYPAGITSASNPALGVWIQHGRYACANFTGSTTAPAGDYQLTITGTGCGHFFAPAQLGGARYDSCIANTNLSRFFPYKLSVCNGVGVQEVINGVELKVYPNPNNGSFSVSISADDRIAGDMIVMDALSRTVHTQSLDVTGTKQIAMDLGNVAPGVYMLVVNTANGKAVRQFSVK